MKKKNYYELEAETLSTGTYFSFLLSKWVPRLLVTCPSGEQWTCLDSPEEEQCYTNNYNTIKIIVNRNNEQKLYGAGLGWG
jgi:hypothetical protein